MALTGVTSFRRGYQSIVDASVSIRVDGSIPSSRTFGEGSSLVLYRGITSVIQSGLGSVVRHNLDRWLVRFRPFALRPGIGNDERCLVQSSLNYVQATRDGERCPVQPLSTRRRSSLARKGVTSVARASDRGSFWGELIWR